MAVMQACVIIDSPFPPPPSTYHPPSVPAPAVPPDTFCVTGADSRLPDALPAAGHQVVAVGYTGAHVWASHLHKDGARAGVLWFSPAYSPDLCVSVGAV